MKTSTKFLSVLFLSVTMTTTVFAQNVEKTLVKSFNLKGKQTVVMNVEGNVDVKEWNNDIMRVQMSIELSNGTNSMLKSLVQARRYNIVSAVDGDALNIKVPGLSKTVKVGGQSLTEKITYTVFAPKDVEVKLSSTETASANTENSSSSLE